MKTIRIIRGGCGVSYKDENGVARHALKTPESGPFQCDDTQADRFVRLGVATYEETTVEFQQEVPPETEGKKTEQPDESQQHKTIKGYLDAADLESWDYNKIVKLASNMGVSSKSKKKEDLIAAIVAVEVETPSEEDDDLPPDLDAADPE